PQQVAGLRRIFDEVVQFARRPRRVYERLHDAARRAFGDVPRQIEQRRPRCVVLDVAVLLRPDRADRVEGVVVRLRGVDLGAYRLAVLRRRAQVVRMRYAVDVVRDVEVEQFEERRQQVDTAEQLVV